MSGSSGVSRGCRPLSRRAGVSCPAREGKVGRCLFILLGTKRCARRNGFSLRVDPFPLFYQPKIADRIRRGIPGSALYLWIMCGQGGKGDTVCPPWGAGLGGAYQGIPRFTKVLNFPEEQRGYRPFWESRNLLPTPLISARIGGKKNNKR